MRRFLIVALIVASSVVALTFALKSENKIVLLDIPVLKVDFGKELNVNLSSFVNASKKPISFQIKEGKGRIEENIYSISSEEVEESARVEIEVRSGNTETVMTLELEISDSYEKPSMKIELQKVFEGEPLELELRDFTSGGSGLITYEVVTGVGFIEGSVYHYTPEFDEAPSAYRVTLKAIDERNYWYCETFSVLVLDVNHRPEEPNSPYPSHGVSDFMKQTVLSWSCNDPDGDNLFFDVYFGEDGNMKKIAAAIADNSLQVAELLPGRKYTWQVVANDGRGGESSGTIWNFSTKEMPKIRWKRLLGGSAKDSVFSIDTLADGSFIMAGYSESSEIQTNRASSELFRSGWVVRLDGNGNLAWQKAFDFGWTEFMDIIPTADGGYLVVGRSSPGQGYSGDSHRQLLVVKLDRFANVRWKTVLSGLFNSAAAAVEVEEGFLVLGTATDEKTAKSSVSLLKLDQSGRVLWEKSFGGSLHDRAVDMALLPGGDVVIVAETESSDEDSIGNTSTAFIMNDISIAKSSVLVVRVDELGNKTWSRVFGGSGEDSPAAVKVNGEGEIFVCGSTNSADGDFPKDGLHYDGFLLKISPEGSLLWNNTYGGRANDGLQDLVLTDSGGAVMVGFTESADDGLGDFHRGELEKLGLTNSNFWVLQVDRNGGLLWSQCYGGSLGDVATSITRSGSGYVIGGYTASSDGDVPSNRGNYDTLIFLLR